ncbi:DNA end-binding protein Ku [Roseimicrobium gellanilyticum]|uniref:Non-homologous end joining protein Ku n=1 Tax=Roseimicrobium gellanilyticum TaxID=748857 RepID=A0A366HFU0_9BACT|nr:Ku protein [Roseimicrobium gellanilyticum]RBP41378.1 DNA end-binding protein Ku [Roseimicrobium gellanilyticum]
MRAIWKGSISFGLVNIPVALYPATHTEDLKFRLLRSKDLSPVNYKRVAEADGKEVPWDQIVKGYEYEKGKFVVIKEEDFKRVDIEATQTVDILNFVELEEVNPVYFHKPYYMEPQKGGDRAYILLREALESTGKIGIAKVVIKTRQHLAALKPQGDGLMLELMHFAAELRDVEEFRHPRESKIAKKELDMAKALISSMTEKWEPEAYKDDYREALEDMIEEKVKHPDKAPPKKAAKKRPSNVIDLVAVLQESMREGSKAKKKTAKAASPSKKKPAAKKRTKTRKAA